MPDPPTPIPAFHSDAHLAHAGLLEVMGGRPIPCWEMPERAVEIRAALAADASFHLTDPDTFGTNPILAVHERSLLEVVDHVWADAVAAGHDPSQPLIPDTFKLSAYPGPMTDLGLPDSAHLKLGAYCFDTATPIVAGTAAAARAAVDVALSAARAAAEGAPLAYGLCRPPGHHAARAMLGGYCFFNNAAIVAEWMRREGGFARVAILDVDYHHGNGTQQLFWERGDVLYLSLHGDPARAYPYYSGFAAERGAGDGEGATRNYPLPAGAGLDAYASTLADALRHVEAFAPDAPLVLSVGLDTYEGDPIGDLALRTDDYTVIGRMIGELGLPVVALQEGGYALDTIGANALGFLHGLRDGSSEA